MTTTTVAARAAFACAETDYHIAGRALVDVASGLPDFFDPSSHGDGSCTHINEHGEPRLQVVEPGYTRYEDVDSWEGMEDWETSDPSASRMHAHTCGYDAYGDNGIVEYLECPTWNGGCGLTWRMPDNGVDWD